MYATTGEQGVLQQQRLNYLRCTLNKNKAFIRTFAVGVIQFSDKNEG